MKKRSTGDVEHSGKAHRHDPSAAADAPSSAAADAPSSSAAYAPSSSAAYAPSSSAAYAPSSAAADAPSSAVADAPSSARRRIRTQFGFEPRDYKAETRIYTDAKKNVGYIVRDLIGAFQNYKLQKPLEKLKIDIDAMPLGEADLREPKHISGNDLHLTELDELHNYSELIDTIISILNGDRDHHQKSGEIDLQEIVNPINKKIPPKNKLTRPTAVAIYKLFDIVETEIEDGKEFESAWLSKELTNLVELFESPNTEALIGYLSQRIEITKQRGEMPKFIKTERVISRKTGTLIENINKYYGGLNGGVLRYFEIPHDLRGPKEIVVSEYLVALVLPGFYELKQSEKYPGNSWGEIVARMILNLKQHGSLGPAELFSKREKFVDDVLKKIILEEEDPKSLVDKVIDAIYDHMVETAVNYEDMLMNFEEENPTIDSSDIPHVPVIKDKTREELFAEYERNIIDNPDSKQASTIVLNFNLGIKKNFFVLRKHLCSNFGVAQEVDEDVKDTKVGGSKRKQKRTKKNKKTKKQRKQRKHQKKTKRNRRSHARRSHRKKR